MAHSKRTGSSDSALAPTVDAGMPSSSRTIPDAPGDDDGIEVAPASFDLGECIGSGGMGDVFRARDRKLGRVIALKVMHSRDARWTERIAHEAQAQARIDHPNVCKLYGVGRMADGRSFLAMQFVSGESLSAIAPKLALRERVQVVAQVAAGLAAAHERGLVHRDMKPHNVLVERHTGGWHAFVVDFGIAREVDSESAPNAAGTPEYMAPEQITGARIDERTDVYGTGAMLYEMCCGRAPFSGASVAQVLARVSADDPTPLRSIDAGVPRDLEDIVLKCLEKDPARRYPSMLALRADLLRWLDGEPVEARPASMLYRLAKRTQKHRLAVSMAAVALVTMVIAALLLWRADQRATRVAELRERLGRRIERVEGLMRQSAMRPLHDVEQERALVRKELASIEAELPTLQGVEEITARHALGRGYLAIGRYVEARAHLERAWELGGHSPEIAFALGRALAEAYGAGLAEAASLPDPAQRKLRKEALFRDLGSRALTLLTEGEATILESPDYWRAYVASYEERWDDALALAKKSEEQSPGQFEATRLRGAVHLRIGIDRRDHGDYAGAQASFDEALTAFESALRNAPSDVVSHEGACARWSAVTASGYDLSRLTDESFAPALAACDRALVADPKSVRTLLAAGDLDGVIARYRGEHGADREQTKRDYERSIALLDRAVQAEGENPRLLRALGERQMRYGIYLEETAGDPRHAYGSAIDTLERGASASEVAVMLGYVTARRAHYLALHGGSPDADFARGEAVIHKAVDALPETWRLHNYLGEFYRLWADADAATGRDPRAHIQAALAQYDVVIRINPQTDYGYVNECEVTGYRARWEIEQGIDPTASATAARAECERSLQVDPNYADTHRLLAVAHRVAAEWAIASGTDPSDSLAEARRQVAAALGIDARSAPALETAIDLEVLAARYESAHARDPEPALQAASDLIARARALQPGARQWTWAEAEVTLAHHKVAPAVVDAALAAVRADIVAKGESPRARATEGTLLLARARAHAGDSPRDARDALDAFATAVHLDANLAHSLSAPLDEARKLAGS